MATWPKLCTGSEASAVMYRLSVVNLQQNGKRSSTCGMPLAVVSPHNGGSQVCTLKWSGFSLKFSLKLFIGDCIRGHCCKCVHDVITFSLWTIKNWSDIWIRPGREVQFPGDLLITFCYKTCQSCGHVYYRGYIPLVSVICGCCGRVLGLLVYNRFVWDCMLFTFDVEQHPLLRCGPMPLQFCGCLNLWVSYVCGRVLWLHRVTFDVNHLCGLQVYVVVGCVLWLPRDVAGVVVYGYVSSGCLGLPLMLLFVLVWSPQ